MRGQADLTELKGGSLLARAGPLGGLPLDLEAVSYREGALYIGLKSPLSSKGEGLILRIDDAVAQLAKGRVRAASVSRWAALALCPEAACEGVSDLAWLSDGSLLLVANAPKGATPDGGGSLWRFKPGGTPELLRRFPGLKPEGVTLTPKPSVAIVFDRHGEAPLWLELPVPPLAKPD